VPPGAAAQASAAKFGVTGGGAHADHEFAEISTMPERTNLLSALINRLCHRP